MNPPTTIFVVDDEPAVRRALIGVGQLLGLPVVAFDSAQEFLLAYDRSQPGCLVLDVQMSNMTGLELQQKLRAEGIRLPIIMISGHANVRTAVEAMSQGAVTLLEKPFSMQELMAYIRQAIEMDRKNQEPRDRRTETVAEIERLTPKECEVLDLIAVGKTNKEIASQLRVSIRAIEDRRARLMKKLRVRSVAELILLASQRGLIGPGRP